MSFINNLEVDDVLGGDRERINVRPLGLFPSCSWSRKVFKSKENEGAKDVVKFAIVNALDPEAFLVVQRKRKVNGRKCERRGDFISDVLQGVATIETWLQALTLYFYCWSL
ncbi:hypothetical protein AAHE18_03G280600 [Arachis hypogaea]|nr:uncharacterized protein DS421_3g96040 [Arachis hypogaea]